MTKAALELTLPRAEYPRQDLPRFTLDGSPALEAKLGHICRRTLEGLLESIPDSRLEALLLGGGYGRGEGGVLRTRDGDEPYNDVEFYCCVRGNRFRNQHRYGRAVRHLTEELSTEAGIEVEIKLISLAQLRSAPPSMFYYDLVAGHRWIRGDDELLRGCEHHRDPRLIPVSEATRLLLNRCTGLLLSEEKLRRADADESDFVGRNLAKTQLALGDSVLTALHLYHWSCRERHRRLLAVSEAETFPGLLDLIPHHLEGMNFKLHPLHSKDSVSELGRRLEEISRLSRKTWLWIESRRLEHPFGCVRDYVVSRDDKLPETKRWRNRLLNARRFGPGRALGPGGARHPRERLLNALPLLLWENAVRDEENLRHLQHNLRTRSRTRAGLVDRYLKLWRVLQ